MKRRMHLAIAGWFMLTVGLQGSLHAAAPPKPRNPILRVNLSKPNFLLCEPVFVTISIVNTGKTPLKVRKLYLPFRDLKLIITNSAGKAYPLAYTSTLQRDPSRSVTVEPDDSASVVVDLLPLYADGKPLL